MKKRYLILASALLLAGCGGKNVDLKMANSVTDLAKEDNLTEVVGFDTTPPVKPIKIVKKITITQVIEAKDSDLDGVPDIKDKCPNTPKNIQVNPQGCPVLTTLYINFDFGKAKVKKIYYPQLEKVAKILKANPKLKIEIDGHTDNVGGKEYNLKLSQKRAEAVKEVLVKHFKISPNRIVAKGYGEEYPLVPNTTATNRALNRRVEIVALNEYYKNSLPNKKVKKTEKKQKSK